MRGMNTATAAPPAVHSAGSLLREWRQRRRLSQLDLALDADISTRHLSFVDDIAGRHLRLQVTGEACRRTDGIGRRLLFSACKASDPAA